MENTLADPAGMVIAQDRARNTLAIVTSTSARLEVASGMVTRDPAQAYFILQSLLMHESIDFKKARAHNWVQEMELVEERSMQDALATGSALMGHQDHVARSIGRNHGAIKQRRCWFRNLPDRAKVFARNGLITATGAAALFPRGVIHPMTTEAANLVMDMIAEEVSCTGEPVRPASIKKYIQQVYGTHGEAMFRVKPSRLGQRHCGWLPG